MAPRVFAVRRWGIFPLEVAESVCAWSLLAEMTRGTKPPSCPLASSAKFDRPVLMLASESPRVILILEPMRSIPCWMPCVIFSIIPSFLPVREAAEPTDLALPCWERCERSWLWRRPPRIGEGTATSATEYCLLSMTFCSEDSSVSSSSSSSSSLAAWIAAASSLKIFISACKSSLDERRRWWSFGGSGMKLNELRKFEFLRSVLCTLWMLLRGVSMVPVLPRRERAV
mmetsp:Transcript_19136/g.48396  ORF Transcript_19136/g.48396 Transcript_19136/m.48396 type:complete len:228 (+) Transcript_19136:247-930(+)